MAFAKGKHSKAISDRSGMEFPYNEMVKEWNGSTVHYTEFEAKHPQLDPKYHPTDPQSLQNAKPQSTSTYINAFSTDIKFAANGLPWVRLTFLSSFLSTISLTIHPALLIKTAPKKNKTI